MAANPKPFSIAPGGSTIRAALPAPPSRQFSFTDHSTNLPTTPQPGDRMDAEYDRTNQAVSQLITFNAAVFNTDGTLIPGSVGKAQLDPSIVDDITSDVEAEVQPLVDQASSYASASNTSANTAGSSATSAQASAAGASASAGVAGNASNTAQTAAATAQGAAATATNQATNASNSANDADYDANLCEEYSVVSQAWAEHMPDTIPPNILAVMNITGDHWSSRWWANQAHLIVDQDTQEAICEIQNYWLGAYSSPPTQNTCGEPIAQGAMYYDLTEQVTKVWDGSTWHPIVQPVPGNADQFLYLPTTPTTTFSGVDYNGNTLAFDVTAAEVLVYLNGVKQLETLDYTLGTNSVTFVIGAIAAPNTVQIVVIGQVPVVLPPVPSAAKVDTNRWTFDGTTTAFSLYDSAGKLLTPPSAEDCVVSLNGVIQQSTVDFTVSAGSITFTTAPQADADKWMLVGLPMQASAAPVNTAIWHFDGTTQQFSLQNAAGDTLSPPSSTACLVSLNGIIQQPGTDYTIIPGFIQFSTPPQSDANAWMVISLQVASGTTLAGLNARIATLESRIALIDAAPAGTA
jgi:hypothetical protein